MRTTVFTSVFARVLVSALLLGACGSDDSTGTVVTGPTCGDSTVKKGYVGSQTLAAQGRTYELYVPDAAPSEATYPLILVFHGDGGTGAGIRQAFNLEAVTGGKAVIVYPDGEGRSWSIDTAESMAKDIAFVDALVDDLATTRCIDKSRVYATGFSKGAYFVNQLACRSKTSFKAIATHAGGGPFGIDGTDQYDDHGHLVCANKSIAALQVQGLSDNEVPPSEGEKPREHWRVSNGCNSSTSAYAPSPCVAYGGCTLPEVYCAIPDLGHGLWSEAAQVTWGFFSK
ncbi:alpha/beta hydrolase family esterase [Labilithrix luteola]|nr:PHB depolymerase family esterase [Labilithrix luteola]